VKPSCAVITLTDEVGRRPPPGGESLVSHTGGALLVETARRSGLDRALSRLLEPWRKPLAIHDPGKIVRAGPVARRKDRLPQHQLRIRGGQHQALDSQLNRGVLTMISSFDTRQCEAHRRFPRSRPDARLLFGAK
jgi:hypothetical protein